MTDKGDPTEVEVPGQRPVLCETRELPDYEFRVAYADWDRAVDVPPSFMQELRRRTCRAGKRDRDLRKSMEVDSFPTMRFDLARVAIADEQLPSDSTAVTLRGRLTIHGVTHDVDIPARVWITADTIRVRGDFPLNLKDYRIGGLSKMLGILKMHENIEVHVDLVFGKASR